MKLIDQSQSAGSEMLKTKSKYVKLPYQPLPTPDELQKEMARRERGEFTPSERETQGDIDISAAMKTGGLAKALPAAVGAVAPR